MANDVYNGWTAKTARRVLYFAYGSNMDEARMMSRVKGATVYGTATIHGWRLAERLYTDIERARGGVVRGVVYAVPVAGLLALDRYEGFPAVYGGADLLVRMDGEGGEVVTAWAYFMTPATRARRDGIEYPLEYAGICAAGARAHGIDAGHWEDSMRRRGVPIR